jgi:phage terminase large subunit
LRGKNGTEFIFRGLRHNMSGIKSMAQIDICIIEEAEDVPEKSWRDLEPTIRAPGSEIWVIWNPRTDSSPVDSRFIKSQPPRSKIASVNYSDNPWFPDVLEEQRRHSLQVMPPEVYAHIWNGDYLTAGDAQIFKGKWRIDDFKTPEKVDRFYFGVDWGFAQDPTVITRSFVRDGCLFIDYEAGGVGIEIDEIPALFRLVPGADRWPIKADSARPEIISAMQRAGFNITAAKKWPGSVEDGIEYMRNFREIVVHERCKRVANEMRLYSYKTDRITGEILPIVVDANNHFCDSVRYALDGYIKPGYSGPIGMQVASL